MHMSALNIIREKVTLHHKIGYNISSLKTGSNLTYIIAQFKMI